MMNASPAVSVTWRFGGDVQLWQTSWRSVEKIGIWRTQLTSICKCRTAEEWIHIFNFIYNNLDDCVMIYLLD
jgi:hypothetical protein